MFECSGNTGAVLIQWIVTLCNTNYVKLSWIMEKAIYLQGNTLQPLNNWTPKQEGSKYKILIVLQVTKVNYIKLNIFSCSTCVILMSLVCFLVNLIQVFYHQDTQTSHYLSQSSWNWIIEGLPIFFSRRVVEVVMKKLRGHRLTGADIAGSEWLENKGVSTSFGLMSMV